MTRPLRVAIIGFGAIAQSKYTPALLKLSDTYSVCVVVNPSAEPRSLAGRRFPDAQLLTELPDDLADLGPLDAALVFTPPYGRPDLIKRLLQAGMHVLAEKPLALTATAGEELAVAASEHNRLLMVAHTRRSDASFPLLQRALDGYPVLSAAATTLETPWQPIVELAPLAKPVDPSLEFDRVLPPAEAQQISAALGFCDERALRYYRWVIVESAIHDLELLAHVLGPASSVQACRFADDQIVLTAMIRFGSVDATLRWVVAKGLSEYQQSFDFISADRRCVLNYPSPFLLNAPARLTIDVSGEHSTGHSTTTEIGSYEDGFLRLLASFAERIGDGDLDPMSAWQAVHALRIAEALATCQHTAEPVDIQQGTHV